MFVESTALHTPRQPVPGVPLAPDRRRRWSRYVAVGDSLSEGLGDPLPGGGIRGWATRFAAHLRQVTPELEFTNLAVRGHRTREAIHRQLPTALALRPDLITVFIGGNDVLLNARLDRARFTDDLDRLLAPLVQPSVTLVLSTLPDLAAAARCHRRCAGGFAAASQPSTRSSAKRRTGTTPSCSTPGRSHARDGMRCGASTASIPAPRDIG